MTRSVLVYPDRAKVGNLYIDLLTRDVEGHDFVDWSPSRALRFRGDLVHLHWPESVWVQSSSWRSLTRGVIFLGLLRLLRLRGHAVVMTVHNELPHENPHPRIDGFFRRRLSKMIDRAHVLSEHGAAMAARALGPGVPTDLLPIGAYTEAYDAIWDEPRRVRQRQFLHFGYLRPYKNVPLLVDVFRRVALDGWSLRVAGEPSDAELESEVRRAGSGAADVRLDLERVDDRDVPRVFGGATLFVAPFSQIDHSASVLLSLSLNIPVLAPRQGSLPELQEVVGDDWLRLIDGELDEHELELAATWAAEERAAPPDLSTFDWALLRVRLAESYAAACAARS